MTNEMLTWMERTRVPFVATTNLKQALDPATARRFLFKIELKPLSQEGARALFAHSFGIEAPPALDRLHDLTPGDFALVARKARILDQTDADELLAMFELEAMEKPNASRKAIGFGSSR